MVADDTEVVAQVSDGLRAAGFSVAVAPGPVAVLDAIAQARAVAVVVDVAADADPSSDALQVIDAVRSGQPLAHLPIVALVDRATDAGARAVLTRGADDFVYKPLDGQELGIRIDALMRRRGPTDLGRQAKLEIHLFGPLRVVVDGQTVVDEHFSRRKAKALLVHLYLNRGRYVPRYRLLEDLWPDVDDAPAGRLKQTVSILRATIEPPTKPNGAWRYIRERGGRYYFDASAGYWSDVEAFEQELALARAARTQGEVDDALRHYERAFALRTGEFLVEFREDDWATPEATRVQELYLEALEDAARLHTARGEHGPAIDLLRQVVAADPLREATYVDLMRALWLSGQRTEALRIYQRLIDVLVRAFQVAPQPEATRLYEAIRAGEPQEDRSRLSAGDPHPSGATR
jgi:DNA-binding SARP family transcriptional activator